MTISHKKNLKLGSWVHGPLQADDDWKSVLKKVRKISIERNIQLVQKYVDLFFSMGTLSDHNKSTVYALNLNSSERMSLMGCWCLGFFSEATQAVVADSYRCINRITDAFDLDICKELYPDVAIIAGLEPPKNCRVSRNTLAESTTIVHSYLIPWEFASHQEIHKMLPKIHDLGLSVSVLKGSSEEIFVQLLCSKTEPARIDVHPGKDWFDLTFCQFGEEVMEIWESQG